VDYFQMEKFLCITIQNRLFVSGDKRYFFQFQFWLNMKWNNFWLLTVDCVFRYVIGIKKELLNV